MNNQLMNKPICQKCQNLQLIVDCGGDFIIVYWILLYLKHPIHVWNRKNGQIMARIVHLNK
jgi:hypothetical protein